MARREGKIDKGAEWTPVKIRGRSLAEISLPGLMYRAAIDGVKVTERTSERSDRTYRSPRDHRGERGESQTGLGLGPLTYENPDP